MMDPDDFHIFISKKRDKQDRKVKWNQVNEHIQMCHLLQIEDKNNMLSAEAKLDSFTKIWITTTAEQQLLLLGSCSADDREKTLSSSFSLFLWVVIQSYAWRTSDIHKKIEVFYRFKCLDLREIKLS